MLETEFIKSLQNNYERLKLDGKPEEKRYQYCILSRGGVEGLLPCSLRYINGEAFLYYDITSKQTVATLFRKKKIDRAWVKDFLWNLKKIRSVTGRFLLDERNLIWYPEQVFQDWGDNILSFLYVPYFNGDNGFMHMLEFLVERMDYGDEQLVETVYRIYENYEQGGDSYLQKQIFIDAEALTEEDVQSEEEDLPPEETKAERFVAQRAKIVQMPERTHGSFGCEQPLKQNRAGVKRGKGILSLLDFSGKKTREQREEYRRAIREEMDGFAVAEEAVYEGGEEDAFEEADDGQTVYMENVAEKGETVRRLYTPDGKVLISLGDQEIVIGKKEGDADLILPDPSVSRLHARISVSEGEYYLEDQNSTNGTFKNGLRLKPYEKKKLSCEDELRFGNVEIVFR